MEFKSTLEKESEKQEKHLKETLSKGYDTKPVNEVFELITQSGRPMTVLGSRAIHIARIIQPSISEKDLKIATNMMCALASQLVLQLKEEGLIRFNK